METNTKRFIEELNELCQRYGALYGMPYGCSGENGTLELAIWLRTSQQVTRPTLEKLRAGKPNPS